MSKTKPVVERVKTRIDHIKEATEAHSNLNAFHAIVALLEGGIFYGPSTHAATRQIDKICQKESTRQLRIMDRAVRLALKE